VSSEGGLFGNDVHHAVEVMTRTYLPFRSGVFRNDAPAVAILGWEGWARIFLADNSRPLPAHADQADTTPKVSPLHPDFNVFNRWLD
jgi:hypothetical protein